MMREGERNLKAVIVIIVIRRWTGRVQNPMDEFNSVQIQREEGSKQPSKLCG